MSRSTHKQHPHPSRWEPPPVAPHVPTMIESAVLYSCCARFPSSMGIQNSIIRFHGAPSVISRAANSSFMRKFTHSFSIPDDYYTFIYEKSNRK